VAELRVLVLGVGNVLMGDEGVGVHAVRELDKRAFPPGVTVLDGGTGGFHLLSHLCEADTVLMIDATLDGKPPGTISVITPRYASDFPRALSAHDIGLKDLVESAALIGRLPEITLITVSVADLQPMQMTLSPEVAAAVPGVLERACTLIERLSAGAPPRPSSPR
jgi:hydrogenase maturation protease